jgi:hypothetical protein
LITYYKFKVNTMANRISRYSAMHASQLRANTASAFPTHVFVRAANHRSNIFDRIGDR